MPRLLLPLTALLLLWSCAGLAPTAAGGEDRPKKPSYLDATAKYEGKTLPEWTAKLADKDDFVRDQAATAVAKYGPSAKAAVPGLLPLLKNPADLSFTSALLAISAIGPAAGEAVDSLVVLLKHKDANIRVLAAGTFPDLGPAAGKAVQPLIAALNDKKVGTDEDRDSIRCSLTQIGKYDIRAVYAAVRQDKLTDADLSRIIETLGTADEHAVAGLVAELKGRQADPVTHNWHIYTMAGLKRIGPKAAPALPELQVLLKDKSEIVRGCAAEAIKAIDVPKKDAPKKDGPPENIPASPASADDDFPITLADVKKELGAPTEGDKDVLDYRDKLNVRVSPLGHMEVQAMTSPAGRELTTKLFTSKLFKDEEGKAILELVKARGGEKKVGRFEITAKESAVVNGMVILRITPLDQKGKDPKSTPPKPLDPMAIAAWKKAGASAIWVRIDPVGPLFEEAKSPQPGDLPTFHFIKPVPARTLAALPQPAVPFGVALPWRVPGTASRDTDGMLKELVAFGELRALDLFLSDVTDAGLLELPRMKNLRSLNLSSTKISDKTLDVLAKLDGLTTLSLGDTEVTADAVKKLAGCKQLTILDLSDTKATDAGLKDLCQLVHLRSLNLRGTTVTDAGLKGLPALEHLTLRSTQVTDGGVKELASLERLSSLDLGGTKVTDASLKHLPKLKYLRSLDLGGTKVTDGGIKELAALKQLGSVNLSRTQVTDAGLKELIALKQLTSLQLSNTGLKDVGLKELAKLKHLRSLHLGNTQVTDAGLGELAALEHLDSLDLYYTGVGDGSVKQLAALKQLTYLNLVGTNVTDAGLKELKQALPKCHVQK